MPTTSEAIAAAVAPVVTDLHEAAARHLASDVSLAHTAECAGQHFAPWMIEEQWFRSAVEAVKNGTLKPRMMEDEDEDRPKRPDYTVHDGVAVVPLVGALGKAAGKYIQTGTVDTRRAIRRAVHDDNVHSILLHIDSPGGTVAGTADLSADVRVADSVKPVYAHIDDLGASAAYWVASQARRVTANATGRVGSIGTLLVLDDTSGMYAAKGIKVHVISTGKFKGAGADGAPITPEQIAMFQEGVDDLNAHFLIGVSKGRKMSMSAVRELADGRVHIASKAKDMGLIDDVASLETAVAHILKDDRERREAAVVPTNEQSSAAAPATTLSDNPAGTAAPQDSQRSEPAPDSTNTRIPDMATDTVIPAPAPAPVAAPAAPDINTVAGLEKITAQNHFDRGVAQGRLAERVAQQDLMRNLMAAAPGKVDIAVNAFLTGQSPESVKLAFNAAQGVEQAMNAQIAALQLENARQLALASAGGYVGGVPTGVSKDDDQMAFAPGTPPETQAKMEWDGNYNNCRNSGATEKQFTLARVAQLKGNVAVLKKN